MINNIIYKVLLVFKVVNYCNNQTQNWERKSNDRNDVQGFCIFIILSEGLKQKHWVSLIKLYSDVNVVNMMEPSDSPREQRSWWCGYRNTSAVHLKRFLSSSRRCSSPVHWSPRTHRRSRTETSRSAPGQTLFITLNCSTHCARTTKQNGRLLLLVWTSSPRVAAPRGVPALWRRPTGLWWRLAAACSAATWRSGRSGRGRNPETRWTAADGHRRLIL